jgi:BRCA1-associated protein
VKEGLWACLVCGEVNCGRYAKQHALAHFKSTKHAYSLELSTERVWDYIGDAYVHRLICDGAQRVAAEAAARPSTSKLVTPDDDNNNNNNNSDVGNRNSNRTDSGGNDADDDGFSKSDAVEAEYTYLLTSQLTAQRAHYDQAAEEARRIAAKRVAAAEEEAARALAAVGKLERRLAAAERLATSRQAKLDERQSHHERRINALVGERQAAQREATLLRDLNHAMTSNLRDYKTKVEQLTVSE